MNNYARLAAEYYDTQLHPTCANFDELSETYLLSRFDNLIGRETSILEVGAGRSKVGAFLESSNSEFGNLVLLDSSREMLAHSERWIKRGARGIVADAQDTQLESGKFSLIVSSLGDPYNTQKFWMEVNRLLRSGGVCLFTTPAHEWAESFRDLNHRDAAEFVRGDGKIVFVESFVPNKRDQLGMFRNAGLKLIEETAFFADQLRRPVSRKLFLSHRLPVLRGFQLVK